MVYVLNEQPQLLAIFFETDGTNVFRPDHPGHPALRVQIDCFIEHLQDPYFRDRVGDRPSLVDVLNEKARKRRDLSIEQTHFLNGIKASLDCVIQDPISIQMASDHKVFLQDPDYPGHRAHPEHHKWLKQVKQNIHEEKV
jgi:hypothetical protein